MKKTLAFLLVLILASSLAVAQGYRRANVTDDEDDDGQPEPMQILEQIREQVRERVQARDETELREMIQERQRIYENSTQGLKLGLREIHQNQNRVRIAVHALLSMEDLVGGIGKNVSQIAREFNNSVRSTIRAEEKMQNRSGFRRFFAGGDDATADELMNELNMSQQRIEQLQRLQQRCNCSERIQAMLQEQILNMRQEQDRLRELAQNEKKSKGIFGWLWK